MANKNKAKGTAAESRIVKFIKEHGIYAERKALTGSKDCGDIEVMVPDEFKWMLEVKSGEQTINPNRSQITEWMRQTNQETDNCWLEQGATWGFLVVARHGKSVKDYDVWGKDESDTSLIHWYLDDFCTYIKSEYF